MPRAFWILIIGMIINVIGSSFLWPLNTIYIHDHLGKSLTIAGLVLMINAGAGVIGNLVGGTLFDKIGGFKAILIGVVIVLINSIILVFFNGFMYYTILLVGLGFGSGLIFPSMFAMAGTVWKEGGRKSFNAVYVAQNLGVAVGTALGGFVASFKFEYVFLANTIMYTMFFLLVLFGFRKLESTTTNVQTSTTNIIEQSNVVVNKSKLIALSRLSVGFFICWLAYSQWASTISTHTQSLGISLKEYSLLWTINGALIVLGQPIISMIVNKWLKNLKQQILFGIVIFGTSFIVVTNAAELKGFIIAMIILTLGEMFVWPAVPTIANQLAPQGRAGFYQGFVNSTSMAGRMVGPLFGGIIVDLYGITQLFYVLIGILLIAIITTSIYDRKIKHVNVLSGEIVAEGVK